MRMALERYKRKRNLKQTPEPPGRLTRRSGQRFVVQEHHARRLHYDFRLEMHGVLKSWAVPKGPSMNPRHRRLAVEVEDHPVAYLTFEGHIEEGNYGAGEVVIWDTGTYELVEDDDPLELLERGKLNVRLHGETLRGEFTLVRMQGESSEWLLIKRTDEFADSNWELQPLLSSGRTRTQRRSRGTSRTGSKRTMRRSITTREPKTLRVAQSSAQKKTLPDIRNARPAPMTTEIEPMLATLVDKPFDDANWFFETKWDGIRAFCVVQEEEVKFISRRKNDVTFRYPELAAASAYIDAKYAVLDGEIVALDASGRPNFQRLQSRVGLDDRDEIVRLSQEHPVAYYAFDLIYYNGFDLRNAPLIDRKSLLKKILRPDGTVRYSEHMLARGKTAFAAAKKAKLEGIVAKHSASAYIGGKSSRWLKVKATMRQEVVIGGFTQPRKSREHFGALVVGLYQGDRFVYVGHVGGGFSQKTLRETHDALIKLAVKYTPFDGAPHTNEPVQWVQPKLVCEVKFAEWTTDRRMRQPIFLGLRDDKDPKECVFEIEHDVESEVERVNLPRTEASEASTPVAVDDLLTQKKLNGTVEVVADLYRVTLTNLEKIYFPRDRYTKGDLIRYYAEIAQYLLQYLNDRPLILKRYPNGIDKSSFFQHDIDNVPEYVNTVPLPTTGRRTIDYVICNNLGTLLYLVNLGTIPQNPWHSRLTTLDHPDWVVFDLDPAGVPYRIVCDVALALRDLLNDLDLVSYPKTSGSRGMHVYVPIVSRYTYEETARFAHVVATIIAARNPNVATTQRSLKNRAAGHVYIDHLQNARGKTLVAPYSVRARDGATVSTPIRWDEVQGTLHPSRFTIETVVDRLKDAGDVFEEVLTKPQRLDTALWRAEELRQSLQGRASRAAAGRANR
jgi:bifunctional non-homologous end joining protein LigD